MAIVILPYSTSWRDAKGWIGRVRVFITGDNTSATLGDDVAAIADGLRVAIAAMTNAVFQGSSGLDFDTIPTLTYGSNSEYPAEWQKAVMQWSTDTAQISRFKIPAPRLAIFDSDGVTVLNDGTQTQVVNYVAAMKAVRNTVFISNKSGLPFTHFEGGLLRFGRQPRRFNERVKSSHLVQGEGE